MLKIDDFAMKCCGAITAGGFSFEHWLEDADIDRGMQAKFDAIEEHQRKYRRNCCLITLGYGQHKAREFAERNGYKEITKFYNPNTLSNVSLYMKVLWNDKQEYQKDMAAGKQPKVPSLWATESAGVINYAV